MRKLPLRDKHKEIKEAMEFKKILSLKADSIQELLKIRETNQVLSNIEQSNLNTAELLQMAKNELKDMERLMNKYEHSPEIDVAYLGLSAFIESFSLKLPTIVRNENEKDDEYSERRNKTIRGFVDKYNREKGNLPE